MDGAYRIIDKLQFAENAERLKAAAGGVRGCEGWGILLSSRHRSRDGRFGFESGASGIISETIKRIYHDISGVIRTDRCKRVSYVSVSTPICVNFPPISRTATTPSSSSTALIIDATAPFTVAYKPNLAFYEAAGLDGWRAFEKTVAYLRAEYPEMFIIADAKRGDIGNTSQMYARTFFGNRRRRLRNTIPYMGFGYRGAVPAISRTLGHHPALTSNASASRLRPNRPPRATNSTRWFCVNRDSGAL